MKSSIFTGIFAMATSLGFFAVIPFLDGKPADLSEPVQVFIIMGQSNTLEMGRVKGDKEGSLEYAVKNENLYPFMVDESGNWTSVWMYGMCIPRVVVDPMAEAE